VCSVLLSEREFRFGGIILDMEPCKGSSSDGIMMEWK